MQRAMFSLIPFRAIVLVLLLIPIVVVKAGYGLERCPCLTLEEKLAMSDGLIEETILKNFTQRLVAGDVTQEEIDRYGVGCGNHQYIQQNDWCFVDAKKCDLQYSRSFTFKSLFFSHAACGYPDADIRSTLALARNDLKIVLHDNHRGFQGTYCEETKFASFDTCEGTVVELAKRLILRNPKQNITTVITEVPEWIKERAKNYTPFVRDKEITKHAACIYAVSLGAVDMCLGAFTKNLNRALISSYLEMGVSSWYLIVHTGDSDESLLALFARLFAPFSWPLWGATFAVLIFLSVLLFLQEHLLSSSDRKKTPVDKKAVGLAAYDAVLGFFTAGVETEDDPVTWGGRFTILAIAVQILLTTASYTANLTNFLVRDGFSTIINDIDEAIYKKVPVCVLRNKITSLNGAFGANSINFAIHPEDGIEGFEYRSELLDAMDRGICTCAIMEIEVLEDYHGDGYHCNKQTIGSPVIDTPWGIPVSEAYAMPLRTLVTEFMHEGSWNKIQNEARPVSTCSEQEVDAENTKLEVKHMAGGYALSGALALVGIALTLTSLVKKRRRDRLEWKSLPPQRFSENSEANPEAEKTEEVEKHGNLNKELHAAIANLKNDLKNDISELKQLFVFERDLVKVQDDKGNSRESSILFET